jgi:predicted MFS family arabinose efflux permease
VIFVFGKNELNIMIGNFGLGAGMTTMMVSSTILIQHIAPSDMRGRIMSIFQLNMAFAQLMTMPIALLAQWLGLAALFPVLSYLTVLMVVIVLFWQPQLVRAKVVQAGPG